MVFVRGLSHVPLPPANIKAIIDFPSTFPSCIRMGMILQLDVLLPPIMVAHFTVTLFARFLGISIEQPLSLAA